MISCYTDWGLTHYDFAFEKQKQLVQDRLDQKISDTLILTEHHPVYTLGKRKDTQKNLVWDPSTLNLNGIQLAHTNRGGDITYHGPGQIVGYAIISLEKSKDLHHFLRDLEQVLINTLACHHLVATRREGKTGIWLNNRKIAAIGVAVKRWITYHGFALNVTTNLNHFEGIIPCGISAQEGIVTSMHEELKEKEFSSNLDLNEIKRTIAIEFWKIFKER